ncbi:MAG: HAD family hydrolase [Pseudomonadota bacterium]
MSEALARPQELPPLCERDFVLATDLDGTFLGGSEADRQRLYRSIERLRDRIGLIFVTGRDPEFIAHLCDGTDVPWPDYAIGDVGTTIAQIYPVATDPVRPIQLLEDDIAARWANKGDAVRRALDGHPGLTLQSTEFRYRVSYDMNPASYCASAEDKVAGLGLDSLISDKRFFDVLPAGVSKGPSITRLIRHLGIASDRVLVAGDTLNDLSMLLTGMKGVAVGGSEAALIDQVRGNSNVYLANTSGAGGIIEAIADFSLFPVSEGDPHAV